MKEPNGQTTTYGYDSRNNRIRTTDQLGNVTEMRYDRLDRLVETRTYLATNGLNASSSNKDPGQSDDGIITLKQEWDDLHRMTAQIDDKGNRTSYVYDDLDRKVRTNYQDGTFETSEYNDDSDLKKYTEQNGSVETYTYDAKSRRARLNVDNSAVPASAGAAGTTRKEWGYDGLDRVTRTFDNNGIGDVNNASDDADDDVTCTYVYDSLSRQLRETQTIGARPTLNVDSGWQGAGRKVSCTYPNERKVTRAYDGLDRLFDVREGSATGDLIARFEYVGPGRDIRTTYGNGAVLDKRVDASGAVQSGTVGAGYDNNRRSIRYEWRNQSEVITCYVNTWNGPNGVGTNRRASENREHLTGDNTDTYTFDSTYRMTGFRRDGSAIGANGVVSTRTLDGADKMTAFTDEGTNRNPKVDQHGDDAENGMNEYSSFDGKMRRYDRNGNIDDANTDDATDADDLEFIQDYQNRICEVKDADGDLKARYVYDAQGRRVLRTVIGSTSSPVTRYLYDGWQALEERNATSGSVRCQYVDGRGIDEHLQMTEFTPTGGRSGPSVCYYHSNAQGFVGALTDAAGSAVEFYEYSWLGGPTILAANQQPLPDPNPETPGIESAYNNPYFFQGRRLDPETGLYYYRHRYYSPDTGEFLTIDPLGYWNHGQGNGFSAFSEDGWNNADPMGLCEWKILCNCHEKIKVGKRVPLGYDARKSPAGDLEVQYLVRGLMSGHNGNVDLVIVHGIHYKSRVMVEVPYVSHLGKELSKPLADYRNKQNAFDKKITEKLEATKRDRSLTPEEEQSLEFHKTRGVFYSGQLFAEFLIEVWNVRTGPEAGPLVLQACHTGRWPDTFLKPLAERLNRLVIAPTNTVYSSLKVDGRKIWEPRHSLWTSFDPHGQQRVAGSATIPSATPAGGAGAAAAPSSAPPAGGGAVSSVTSGSPPQ